MFLIANMERRPPNGGNHDRSHSKAVQSNVLDDTTLLTLVSFLYAFFHFFSGYNIDPCSC